MTMNWTFRSSPSRTLCPSWTEIACNASRPALAGHGARHTASRIAPTIRHLNGEPIINALPEPDSYAFDAEQRTHTYRWRAPSLDTERHGEPSLTYAEFTVSHSQLSKQYRADLHIIHVHGPMVSRVFSMRGDEPGGLIDAAPVARYSAKALKAFTDAALVTLDARYKSGNPAVGRCFDPQPAS